MKEKVFKYSVDFPEGSSGDVGCTYSWKCTDFPSKCFMCDRSTVKKSYFKSKERKE